MITIIVLIILAGVSINLVLGQDGVVQKAKEGRDSYADAARIENEQLANVDSFAMSVQEMTPSMSTVIGEITNMTDGEIEISATINLKGDIDFTKTKYVFTTSNSLLGTNDESLYKDGIIGEANSTITKSKAAGTYYLHILTTSTNGAKKEIVSEDTATSQGKKDFDYTGNVQDITLTPGNYKLETWGAEGCGGYCGSSSQNVKVGGLGGYSQGIYNIAKSTMIYIVIGGKGIPSNGGIGGAGYNGGGDGNVENVSSYGSGGGGGATHIGLKSGELKEFSSDYNSKLIICSGGGGGAGSDGCGNNSTWSNDGCGGSAGGYSGKSWSSCSNHSHTVASSGSQSSGGSAGAYSNYTAATSGTFGQGGRGGQNAGGGGGGLYGGGGGVWHGGGGGSGYINTSILTDAFMYGYNVSTSNETATKTYSTTNYSSTATSNYAKQGNGYARITALD